MNNKKLLKISLIICAIAILMASVYEYQQKLDEPIFLKSYIERPITKASNSSQFMEEIYLTYITDHDFNGKISEISLNTENEKLKKSLIDAHSIENSIFPREAQDDLLYRYKFNQSNIQWIFDLNTYTQDIEIDNIIVSFVNDKGESQKYPIEIGKLIYRNLEKSGGREYYEHISSSSRQSFGSMTIFGTEDSGEILKTDNTNYKVNKDIELIAIESGIIEDFPDFFKINVNGVPYDEINGMKLASGSEFYVNVTSSIPSDFLFGEIKIFFTLVYQDSQGNIYRDIAGSAWVRSQENRHYLANKIKRGDK